MISDKVRKALHNKDMCFREESEQASDWIIGFLEMGVVNEELMISASVQATCEILAKYGIGDHLAVYEKFHDISAMEERILSYLDDIEREVKG